MSIVCDLMTDPRGPAESMARFVVLPLDAGAMAGQVDPSLRHPRSRAVTDGPSRSNLVEPLAEIKIGLSGWPSRRGGDLRPTAESMSSQTPNPELRSSNSESPAPDSVPRMRVDIAGVQFQNPVLTASGTFGYGQEFAHLIDLNRLGGICVKGISADPMPGNPPPRIYETESGMLNAIGLQNVGAKRFLEEKLPFLRTLQARCVVNVFGYSTEDYVRCLEILNEGEGIDAYELNISCPNTRCGGMVYGSDPKLTEEVVAASKRVARFPLFVKLSPNVTDIAVFARAAEAAGADALTLVNTFVGMAIDAETRTPRISNVTAGLSGPAIKPLALRLVHQAARAVRIPIIGIGGIASAEDAIEFLIAGARAVQVGTANFYAPDTALQVADGIADYCSRKHINLDQLVGSLKLPQDSASSQSS